MKQPPHPILEKYPYLISVLVHGLILLLFMLISLNPEVSKQWHQFDWIIEQREEPPFTEPIHASVPTGVETPASAIEREESGQKEESIAEENPKVAPIESPLFELPQSQATAPITNIERNPSLTEALSSAGVDTSEAFGTGGYSSSLIEGGSDAYFLHETKPWVTPLMDDVVIVEFKLGRDGRVDMNSLSVISYRKAEHWEALRIAMRDWRFGFTGPYNPAKKYRIRCNFTLR